MTDMGKIGKKVIVTNQKRVGLDWSSVIRSGNFAKARTAIDSGKVTGKIATEGVGSKVFKVEIDDPWANLFRFRHLSFSKSDLIFIEDDFLSDDDLTI